MKLSDHEKRRAQQLRIVAEAQADNGTKAATAATLERSAEELLHELQVHQIELELQNETLRQTQIALEESRDRYVDLYEFAPVAYLTLSGEGLIESINLSGSTMLGVTRSKLKQRRFSHFIAVEDRDRWHRHFSSVLLQEAKLACELVLLGADGTRFNALADCMRLSKDGEAPAVRVALTDVTKLKTAELELHRAQHLARIGNWYWDARSGEIQMSDEIRRIFGREVIPRFAEQNGTLFPAQAWQELDTAIRESLRTGAAYNLELPARRGDGTQIWIQMCSEAVYGPAGKILGLRGTVQDVTERKEAEMALQRSKQLLELTMQMSHTGGWDLNLADHTSHRTRGHDQIFGHQSPLPAWSYEIFLEHVIPEDRAEVDRRFQEAVATKGDWNFVCRIRRVDGEVRWIQAAGGHQADERGAATRLAGVVRDITEARLLEQALLDKNEELERARAVAEKANLAKSDFLSSMSHELRTPLNAILGFAQLMEASTPPPTAKQLKDLDQILAAGWYLLELINEILDLALIESGRAVLSREAVSVGELMLECWTMIEPQAQKRGIRVMFPKLDAPYYLDADRTRIKQVLINLLFNAVKYNQPNGTVEIEISSSAPGFLRISVRDTGAGLPAEKLAQLFQSFNRLGREAGAEEGTGIGLVVTKRLVELMGGTIGVESVVGEGSVFWIELALTTAAPTAMQRASHAALLRPPLPDGGAQRSVLYVEDNPANLALVEDIVARVPDLTLISAADGDLGIEFARAYQPAVILMDINLPGISGLEAMQILRADPETAHIPIIALSAHALARDIARGMDSGFFRYLTKPIKLKEFMEALDSALEFSGSHPGHEVKS